MTVKTVIFVLLFTETSFIYPIFVHVLFRVLYPEKRMKRESGESPEQSRCCEFHARCIILVPLFFGKNGKAMYRERVRRPAVAIELCSSISRLGNSSKLDCTRLNEMVRAAAFRLAPDKKMRRAPIFLSGPECRGALWRRAACVQNRPRYSTS